MTDTIGRAADAAASQDEPCVVCGRRTIGDDHANKACWEYGTDAFDASELFVKASKKRGKRPTWDFVESAFRAGYKMRARK